MAGTYIVAEPTRLARKHGTATAPITILGQGGPILRAAGDGVPGVFRGMIEVVDASHVHVQGLTVENSSFFGLLVERSDHVTLTKNQTTVTIGSGVYSKNSSALRVEDNDVSRFCDRNKFGGHPTAGCQEGISLDNVDGFAVVNNRVHDAPQRADVGPGGGEGIDIKNGSKNGGVSFNSVWNLVQIGIYIDGWAKGVSNVQVHGNRVWNTSMGIVVNSERGGTVSDIDIHDNVVHHVGYDGILLDDLKTGAGGDGPRQRVRIYNNTLVAAGVKESKPPFCRRWSDPCSDHGTGIKVSTSNVSGLEIHDNIVFDARTATMIINPEIRGRSRIENNLVWPVGRTTGAPEFNGSRPIKADPLFLDPAARDFRLRAGSPAIGAGAGGSPLGRDAAGVVRPQGPIDVGAFARVAP